MLKFFKIIGILEGISYLVLFFNMLVIKNFDVVLYKKLLFPIGMAHGLLFVLYVILAVYLKIERKWTISFFIKIFVASLLPFGTFYSEKYWLTEK